VGAIGAVAGSALATVLIRAASRVLKQEDGTALITGEIGAATYVFAAGVALATGVLAAIAPARRAAHLDPVQAIRT
jgi:lipoprotein-releasing system permease protein